jgi:hypothetical protein
VDKDCDLENGVGVQMDTFYLITVQDSPKEVTSWKSKPVLEKGQNTMISSVLGVGMSPLPVGRYCSMPRSGRK